jgi:ammonia channel protein AmtB
VFASTTFGGTQVIASVPAQFALLNAAALAACLWAAGCTWVILKALDMMLPGGIRVTAAEEEMGLDAADHGEQGYAFAPIDAAKPPAPPAAPPAVAKAVVTSLA